MGRLTDQKRFQELFAFAKESDCQCTGVSTDTSHTSTSGSKTSKSSKAGDHHEEHSEAHSEVRVEYSVRCATAPAGTKLKLDIFQHFKGLKSLKVQVVGATQSGMKATPAANLVPL